MRVVVWCDVVQCMRCGAARCGAVYAVRCGAVQYGTVRYGAVRRGTVLTEIQNVNHTLRMKRRVEATLKHALALGSSGLGVDLR